MKKPIIDVDYKISLIQQLRLIHAISEAGIKINVLKSEKFKFYPLIKQFGVKVSTNIDTGIKLSTITNINHEEPKTTIGKVERPIIFPNHITDYCFSLWKINRKYRFTFVGLVTDSRKTLLENWLNTNTKFQGTFDDYINQQKLQNNVFSKLINLFGNKSNQIKNTPELFITNSSKGRQFPGKSLDHQYFKILSNSKFVLCPSGDYTWTYRFFESILCGAIPVIEETCDAYKGFKYYLISDDAEKLVWSREDALYNYQLCIERITIPAKDILKELTSN